MIISEVAKYRSDNAGQRPAWNKQPLMGAHRGGSSRSNAGSSSSTPLPVQVSNNRNPNSTTTPNYHTAPTCPIFTRSNAAATSSNGFVSQSHGVNDHYSYINHDGSTHHHCGRFMRHLPPPPPPHGPFVNPIGFLGAGNLYYVAPPPPDALRDVPAVTYFHATQLHCLIVKQIDYYFTKENLVKDIYLRQMMDDQGWVPIKLIAGFNKVKLLTSNIRLILDALQGSMVVEVKGDKIRRRNDWIRWIMVPTGQVGVQWGSDLSATIAN
ncbi:hypothetical protein QYF36_022704 [Acer negundo]|nr:hypothetical protein QYF36_022704 [Acer negundo]